MILVAFELSMPSAGSWNGKWTGEDRYYARVRNITKHMGEKYEIESKLDKYFTYRWNDGWCAGVHVRKVDHKEAAKIRKKSAGFCGYDWMIDSILYFGDIQTRSDRIKKGGSK